MKQYFIGFIFITSILISEIDEYLAGFSTIKTIEVMINMENSLGKGLENILFSWNEQKEIYNMVKSLKYQILPDSLMISYWNDNSDDNLSPQIQLNINVVGTGNNKRWSGLLRCELTEYAISRIIYNDYSGHKSFKGTTGLLAGGKVTEFSQGIIIENYNKSKIKNLIREIVTTLFENLLIKIKEHP